MISVGVVDAAGEATGVGLGAVFAATGITSAGGAFCCGDCTPFATGGASDFGVGSAFNCSPCVTDLAKSGGLIDSRTRSITSNTLEEMISEGVVDGSGFM